MGKLRADDLAAGLTSGAWQRLSAGAGAKGHRFYDRAWLPLPAHTDAHGGHHWMLIRRQRRTGELAFYRCWSPQPIPLATLVAVAGTRWKIEEAFQAAKTALGLDQHQNRRWTSWHRWTTLVILAHAFLATATATTSTDTTSPSLVRLSVNELRHLFTILIIDPSRRRVDPLRWSIWRRRHQARATASHYAQQALTEPRSTSPAGVLAAVSAPPPVRAVGLASPPAGRQHVRRVWPLSARRRPTGGPRAARCR